MGGVQTPAVSSGGMASQGTGIGPAAGTQGVAPSPAPGSGPGLSDIVGSTISGLGGTLRDLFKGEKKPLQSKTGKPDPREIAKSYPLSEPKEKRVLWLLDYFYREGSFEKVQFARKWMRNALIFQGYHELEWSEINVAWDIIMQDSGDYAFPNNYYRTLILHGVKAYLQSEPIIEPIPSNDDGPSQAATKAAKGALEIIKQAVQYDRLRVIEAIYLHLFGNSLRYTYFSKDPRFGYVTSPVYQDADVMLSPGTSTCPIDGIMEGVFDICPACQTPIIQHGGPVISSVPNQIGTVRYPRGEVMTEIVNPLEIYMRSSSYDLWHVPFLIRNRVVDRTALQSQHPNLKLAPTGDEGGGEAYSTGGDLGLIYLQSLADLPGDPTQYAAWYERATASAKALLIEGWIRPSQYFFDKEMLKAYPNGLYGAKTGDILIEARNDTIEDHWTHYIYTPVPGRIWGDGDDDLIPQTLKLDETDRLIQRNQGYNSSPLLVIDSQRIDKDKVVNDPSTIIDCKPAGKPVGDAVEQLNSAPLSQETWQWRNAHLQDLYTHARIAPSATGQHEPGVNTFGGQESMAAKSDSAMLPNFMLWKGSDQQWATQALKLASINWLDTRVHSVFGINGKWEFQKLQGAAINMDRFSIETRVMPIDPSQQDAMSQAIASGALDPQDPRVKARMMELFHLSRELDSLYDDQKVQWEEIEQMKLGKPVMPELIIDNDAAHIDICRLWLNSDEGRDPQFAAARQLVKQHLQAHVFSQVRMAQMQQLGQPQQQQGQQQGPPGKQPGGGGNPNEGKQAGKHGGQVPPNPQERQARAVKGQAAKPQRPQPSSGNQFHRERQT